MSSASTNARRIAATGAFVRPVALGRCVDLSPHRQRMLGAVDASVQRDQAGDLRGVLREGGLRGRHFRVDNPPSICYIAIQLSPRSRGTAHMSLPS